MSWYGETRRNLIKLGTEGGTSRGQTGDANAVVSYFHFRQRFFLHVNMCYALLSLIIRERRLRVSKCAACRLVPNRIPIHFLTRVAAVPGGLALRATFEVLQKAHNLAPVVDAIRSPLERFSAELVEHVDCIMYPLRNPSVPRRSRRQGERRAPP